MTIQAPSVCWDVRDFVLDVERDEDDERIQENYRKINLFATLTFGITHEQLFRTYDIQRIIGYWLDETIQQAHDNGYFLSDGDCDRFRAAARTLAAIPETRGATIGYLYCQDVRPPFPWDDMRDGFLPMTEAGLCLPFLERTCLDRIPRTERVMDDFLRSYGRYSVAEMYDTSSPSYFTGRDFAALKMAKRLKLFGGKDNDRACQGSVCVDKNRCWCSLGETGCALGSDPY